MINKKFILIIVTCLLPCTFLLYTDSIDFEHIILKKSKSFASSTLKEKDGKQIFSNKHTYFSIR